MFKILINSILTILLSCLLIFISYNIQYLISINEMEVKKMESVDVNYLYPKIINKNYLLCDGCGIPKENLESVKLPEFNTNVMLCEDCKNKYDVGEKINE